MAAMRVVGGEFRGRRLVGPDGDAVRPTSDRTRESLFSILSNRIDFEGLRVLDLFAGTGALGIEALSRGASFALFIDNSAQGRALVRTNLEALGLTGRGRLFRRDAAKPGEIGTMEAFDLVFLDPPYGRGLGEAALAGLLAGGWLKPEATIVLEEERGAVPAAISGYSITDRRSFGGTEIIFLAIAPDHDDGGEGGQ
jgi:16S rRNA (guanine966-N2)-methyltransferase